jgi:hypothetical protein
LHANGFQTLGTCWSKEEDGKSKCNTPGWYGAANVTGTGPGNPADYAVGTVAVQCGDQGTNEKKKSVLLGAAFPEEKKDANCPIVQYLRVARENGKNVWKSVDPTSTTVQNSNRCGKYNKVILSGACDETTK